MTAPLTIPTCRYGRKRQFGTREQARDGARLIRAQVEYRGGIYQALYPYKCPDLHHWHLSHHRQGYVTCPVCRIQAPAWYDRACGWIIAAHDGCDGEGTHPQ